MKLYRSPSGGESRKLSLLSHLRFLPESTAKIQPNYIPEAILSDYNEASSIVNKSPKASATLSRRCLQGMIRDFFGISKRTLHEEIQCIEQKVDPSVWQAIDSVRSIGNIGAHMEKDVNVIVDIEPDEAAILITLIEQLFQEWYVVRYQRQERLATVKAIADAKKAAKSVTS